MTLATIMIIVLWAEATPATLQTALPKYLNANYTGIISAAQSQFPDTMAPPTYTLFTFLGSLAFGVGAFNSYWNSWAVGEVKRGNEFKREYLAMLVGSTFWVALVLLAVGVAEFTAGRDFLVALTQLLTNNPGFFVNVPTSFIGGLGTLLFVPMIVADNFWVQFILMIGIISAGVVFLPMAWLLVSRDWFAWSFDRIVPARFASVNDRFHAPVFDLVWNFVILEILMAAIVFVPQYFGFILTASWSFAIIPVTIYMLVPIVLPFRKHLWSVSPVKNVKWGAILIIVTGIIGFVFMADSAYFFATTAAFGFGLPSTEILVTFFVLPFVAYWIIRQIRRRQGIDLDLIFRMVPPE
jgi:amino acid transporter